MTFEIAKMKFSQSPPVERSDIAGYLNRAKDNTDEGWFMFDWQVVICDQEHTFPPLSPTYIVIIRWAEQ
jgi:hypothetical protein